jgi:hypothetical protein
MSAQNHEMSMVKVPNKEKQDSAGKVKLTRSKMLLQINSNCTLKRFIEMRLHGIA